MKQTGSKQVPWEASSLVGSFYFSGAPDSKPITTAKIDPVAFELSYWETIKNSQNAEDFKAYLARYPQGEFVELAKNRIANLGTPAKPTDTSPLTSSGGAAELAFWDAIKNSTSADDYRAYLEKYPNGEFAGLARRRLAPLEASEKEKAKADEVTRNIKRFKGSYVLRGAMVYVNSPGTLVVTPSKIEFVFDDVEPNRINGQVYKPYTIQCSDLNEARTDDVYVREIRDGRQRTRFQAESASVANDALAAMRYVCANPGKNFTDSAGRNSNDATPANPNAKMFSGYLGIMSAGFYARPGKMVIAPSGVQFVWDKGTAGIAENTKAFDYKLHPDPAPTLLQCSYFAVARTDGFFVREINTGNPAALLEVIGSGGAILRFRASSPDEATTVLAAVHEACKNLSSGKVQ
jgi:hypothetical protein